MFFSGFALVARSSGSLHAFKLFFPFSLVLYNRKMDQITGFSSRNQQRSLSIPRMPGFFGGRFISRPLSGPFSFFLMCSRRLLIRFCRPC